MNKPLLLTLLVFISFGALAMSKKKQMELLEACTILPKEASVFAGYSIPSYLALHLSNGDEIYSNKRSKIGFKDFNVTISGSGSVSWLNKRKLVLRSDYNAVEAPYIQIEVELKNRPEIRHTVSIPIHFDGAYNLRFSAGGGSDGRKGENGCRGSSGGRSRGSYNGCRGGQGSHGYDGYNGSNGRDARNVSVYVQSIESPHQDREMFKATVNSSRGSYTRYISSEGRLRVYAIGGSGGNGGRGGNGGGGGCGGEGAYKRARTADDPGCRYEGFGGDGGDGGNAGDGGFGGNGGRGGDVYVYFAENAWVFMDNIEVYNYGGRAGCGGKAGVPGNGGSAGRGGKGCGRSGYKGQRGRNGYDGSGGQSGDVHFLDWN